MPGELLGKERTPEHAPPRTAGAHPGTAKAPQNSATGRQGATPGSDTSDRTSGSGLSPGYKMIISELRNKVLEKARTIIESISSKAAGMTHQNRKQETEKHTGPSFINDFLLMLYPEKKKKEKKKILYPKKEHDDKEQCYGPAPTLDSCMCPLQDCLNQPL